MADSILVAVVSGLTGALLGGLGQAVLARYAAFKEAQTVAASIRAELLALCQVVEQRNYIPVLDGIVGRLMQPGVPTQADIFTVAVTQDYFQVFNAHVGQLGALGEAAASVVSVYTLAKSALEDVLTLNRFADQGAVPRKDMLLAFTMDLRRLMNEFNMRSKDAAEELHRFQQRRWFL